MAYTDPQLKIRLPRELKEFIAREARKNASSQNSEIVRAIRAAMKAKGPAEAATSPSQSSANPVKGKANEPVIR